MNKPLNSLTFKLGTAVFVVSVLGFAGLGFYSTHLFSKQIDEQLAAQSLIPGHLMNQQALPYRTARDLTVMSELTGEEVVQAAIVKRDGLIHYASDASFEGTLNVFTSLQPESTDSAAGNEALLYQEEEDAHYLLTASPLFAQGQYLGVLHLKINTSSAVHKKESIASFFLISGIFGVLLTTLSGAYALRRLTMPRIEQARKCLRTVADGNYNARIEGVISEDELGRLETGINYMASQLESREEQNGQINRELHIAKNEAESASRSKSSFLANMSHEIRTPMNAIIGIAQIMDECEATPEQQEYIESISASAHALLMLVNNILDLSRIESGRFEITEHPTQIGNLLEELRRILTPSAKRKGFELRINVPNDIPANIQIDEGALRQILINLISNAVKFTDEGYIEVAVLVTPTTDKECLLNISVTDTGIGISESDQDIIFEDFTQADDSLTRKYGGSGLGLAISQQLARKMGGEITVSSRPGQGSVFQFSISVPYDMEQDPSKTETIKMRPPEKMLSILLVEDNRMNQAVVGKMLEKENCIVEYAEEGKTATDKLNLQAEPDQRPQYDIIFMDVQMPVMDGIEATEIIRKQGYTAPIVAITAHAMKGDREKFIECGMDDYLTKPIRKEELSAILNKWGSSEQ